LQSTEPLLAVEVRILLAATVEGRSQDVPELLLSHGLHQIPISGTALRVLRTAALERHRSLAGPPARTWCLEKPKWRPGQVRRLVRRPIPSGRQRAALPARPVPQHYPWSL